MSMYIGKKTDGVTPILHLTATAHTTEDMKNDPIPDTIFHSDIDVMQIAATVTFTPVASDIIGYEKFTASTSSDLYTGKLSIMCLRFADGSILTAFGVLSDYYLLLWRNDGPSADNQFMASPIARHSPSTAYYVSSKRGVYNKTISEISCYILDSFVDTLGEVHLASSNKTSTDILISDTQLLIGGVNIFSKPILCAIPNKTTLPIWFPFPMKATTGIWEPFSSTIDGDNVSTSFYDSSTNIIHNGYLYGLTNNTTNSIQLSASNILQGFKDNNGITIIDSTMTINSLVKKVSNLSYSNNTKQVYPITSISPDVNISSWYPSVTSKFIVALYIDFYNVSLGTQYTQKVLAVVEYPQDSVNIPLVIFKNADGALNLYDVFTVYVMYSGGNLTLKFSSGDIVSNVVIRSSINKFI